MVQLVVGLVHPREQGSAQRLSPVCQRWYSRSSDGVVVTHSIKYNTHGPFLNAFELVCLLVTMHGAVYSLLRRCGFYYIGPTIWNTLILDICLQYCATSHVFNKCLGIQLVYH